MKRGAMARYLPLLAHVLPTLVIGYGWVIPRSCVAGWNALSVGFGLSVASTVVAYVLGQRAARPCPQEGPGLAEA